MRKRLAIILLGVMMFGVSSESHAFLEWLYKLSGPGPFIGAKIGLRFTCPEGKVGDCRLVEWGIGPGFTHDGLPKYTGQFRLGYAESLRNDLEYDEGTDPPKVYHWSIEGSLERWTRNRKYFGSAGLAFTEFQGRNFTDFRRNAAILRAGRRWEVKDSLFRSLEVGPKLTIFEDQFRPSDFGAIGEKTESQAVFGFFASAYVGPKRPR